MPCGIDLDRLGVLAADVEHRRGARIHHVRAEPVAQDLGADVLLRERQPRPAVAGADDVGLLHVGVEDALDRRLDLAPAARGVGQLDERALERREQVPLDRVAVDAVLDLDDRAVEHVEQEVVADAGFLGDRLAGREVLAAGDVAEEVRLALGARREERRRFRREPPEHFGQRFADRLGRVAERGRREAALAGRLQVAELLEVLLRAEVALELAEEAVERAVERARAPERLPEQVEAAVDQRLLLGDRRRGVVVRARVGDAASEDVLVLVHHHRLGGRGAEIDADEAAHGSLRQCAAAAATRFSLTIWK